jgi:allantoin racemase
MRILVVNPNTTQAMTDDNLELALVAAAPGTVVESLSPVDGPPSIEGHADEVIAAHYTLELVAETLGRYDGYVIACFGDPGVAACREIADVPVVGMAEAAMSMAGLVAHRWSIISPIPRGVPMFADLVRRYGLEARCASIRAVQMGVLEIAQDFDRAKRMILEEARRAIDEDGAEAILPGCAGFGPIDKAMQRELGVPVLDGVACGVKLVEALLGYGVTTAKVQAYLRPEPKPLTACSTGLVAAYASR